MSRPALPEMSTTTISRSRVDDTNALVPLTTTSNGYSPPGVPLAPPVLNGRRSYSNRVLAVGMSTTVIESL